MIPAKALKTRSADAADTLPIINHRFAPNSVRGVSGRALQTLRRLALRRRVWYLALTKLERGIVDLTIKLFEEVRSRALSTALASVLAKLSGAVASGYLYRFEVVGKRLAEALSAAAVQWGHEDARFWKYNLSYIRCLGINYLNSVSKA